MKKLLIALISVVLLLTLCSCSNNNSGLRFHLKDDGTYSVTGTFFTRYKKEVVIPETYRGKPVTEIENSAFSFGTEDGWEIFNSHIESIVMPNSITTIGEHAFWRSYELRNVTIPDSVTHIGEHAFRDCYNIKSIVIPEGVTTIEYCAFSECYSLVSVSIPDSVTCIEGYAFESCTSLETIAIPNGVVSIGGGAFSCCTKITDIAIPNGVTNIENFVFSGCTSLVSVTIPNSVTNIGNYAFSGCTSLTSVIIPESVTCIGDSAFADCNLTNITIPDSVTTMGYNVFNGALVLLIAIEHNEKPAAWNYLWCYNNQNVVWGIRGEICVSDDGYIYEINESGATIYGYNGIVERLIIPSTIDGYTVIGIDCKAFNNCDSLKSVSIPDTITYIGTDTFDSCYNLVYNKFDKGYYLGNDSNPYLYLAKTEGYSGCVINDNTKIIDGKAFATWNFSSITIPASVVYIGEYISEYSYSSSLSSITVHEDNQYYKSIDGALYTKDGKTLIGYAPESADTTVVIPDGVTKIEDRAFYGAKKLKSIIIPDTVTDIGEDVFNNCDSNVTIYCKAASRPDSWSKDWNLHSDGKYYIPVVWGYTGE